MNYFPCCLIGVHLFGSNGANVDKGFVVDSSPIVQESANNAFDTPGAFDVNGQAIILLGCILRFCIVYTLAVPVQGQLGFLQEWVAVLDTYVAYVVVYRDAA